MIKGMICGYHIEEIENPLTKQILYLNTLMDELQKENNGEDFAGLGIQGKIKNVYIVDLRELEITICSLQRNHKKTKIPFDKL